MPKYGFKRCADYDPKRHPAEAIAEVKYDGMMVLVEHGRLWNRPREGKASRDVTFQFPEVQVHPSVVLVGEVSILKDGISQFHLLQKRFVDNPKEVRLRSIVYPATLVAFDVLEVNGQDLAGEPLKQRRKTLEHLENTGVLKGVHVAGYWGCPPDKVEDYLSLVRASKGEGIIVKDLDAPYRPTRNPAWMKLKAWKEGDYDIEGCEVTENGGFVVYITNAGYRQKVVVNNAKLAGEIQRGEVRRLTIRYLDEEVSGALRQPHVHGVPWDR